MIALFIMLGRAVLRCVYFLVNGNVHRSRSYEELEMLEECLRILRRIDRRHYRALAPGGQEHETLEGVEWRRDAMTDEGDDLTNPYPYMSRPQFRPRRSE